MRIHFAEEIPAHDRAPFAGLDCTFGGDAPADTVVLVDGGTTLEKIEPLTHLRAVIVPWAGIGGAVIKAAKAKNLRVFNIHHNSGATAQTALALLLAVSRDIAGMDREFRAGSWAARFDGAKTTTLEGKSAVILGMGAVGTKIARGCEALGMHVTGIARSPREGVVGIDDLDGALPKADVLVIALPLTPETRNLFDREKLASMPDGAIVVNIGRGAIIEEQALFDELKSGRFFGAGLDVWWKYPDSADDATQPGECDWASLRNVVMTPHRGGTGVGEAARWAAVAEVLDRLSQGDFETGAANLDLGY